MSDETKLIDTLEEGVKNLGNIEKKIADTETKLADAEKRLTDSDARVKAFEEEIAKIKAASIITSDSSEKAHDGEIIKQFKAMMANEYKKGINETENAQGGYFVPEELSNYIIDTVERYGFTRQLGNVFPMNKLTLRVPSLSGITASVVDEGKDAVDTTPTVGSKTFTAKKLLTLVPFTSEWMDDVNMSVVNKVIELMAVAIATREDQMAFTANGESANGSLTGLLYNSSINSVTMGTGDSAFVNVTWDDISDMIDSITTPVNAASKLRFFMNRTMRGILRNLEATSSFGSPFKADSNSDVTTIWGYPITFLQIMPSTDLSSQASTPFMLFGDPYYLGFGDRRQISVRTFDQYNPKADESAIQVKERCDVQLLDDGAFCRLITAS